jgi:hypothetical protein
MNPFHYFETDQRNVSGVATIYDYDSDSFQMDVGLAVFPASYDTSLFTDSRRDSVDAEALNKSLTNLKGMKVNLGVAMGERKRTADLLYRTAGTIGNSLRALKRGNFSGAAKALGLQPDLKQPSKSGAVFLPGINSRRRSQFTRQQLISQSKKLSDDWLALQYGWRPLINDVYSSMEVLAQASSKPRKFMVSSSKSFNWSKSSSPGNWYGVPYTRVDAGSYTRKYVYIFSYSNEVLTDLSSLGVTNPAAIAWELLPWSFVADWFIPIGNYIDTWDATLGFSFQKGCTTTFEKWRVTVGANGTKRIGNTIRTVSAKGSHDYVECIRSGLASFPMPRLPSFDPRLSFQKGVTSVALLRQRLRL